MLRKSALGLGCTLVLTSKVAAADLPSKVVPPVFLPPPATFSWTGVYIGLNAGYAFDNKARTSAIMTFTNHGHLG